MTAYRFRVKLEWDPTSLWRDIVVGEDRTLEEFQAVINESMGLGQDHLWFFGADQDYWQSDVKYQRPEEYQDLPSGESMRWDEAVYNAGETMIAELSTQLDLEVGDRICYLFDSGDRPEELLSDSITQSLQSAHGATRTTVTAHPKLSSNPLSGGGDFGGWFKKNPAPPVQSTATQERDGLAGI